MVAQQPPDPPPLGLMDRSSRVGYLMLVTAVIVIACAAVIVCFRVGVHSALSAELFFVACGGLIALADIYTGRIANRVVVPVIVLQSALFVIACAPAGKWALFGRVLLAGGLLLIFYSVFALTGSMGAGDAKFAVLIGEALGYSGWTSLFLGVVSGLALALLASSTLIALRRVGRRTRIPFGPFLYLGAAIVLCATLR